MCGVVFTAQRQLQKSGLYLMKHKISFLPYKNFKSLLLIESYQLNLNFNLQLLEQAAIKNDDTYIGIQWQRHSKSTVILLVIV